MADRPERDQCRYFCAPAYEGPLVSAILAHVYCSDSTLRWYAAQQSDWPLGSVNHAYRWSDRWRFILEPSFAPRKKASAAGVTQSQREDLLWIGEAGLRVLFDVVLDPTFPEHDWATIELCCWSGIQVHRY